MTQIETMSTVMADEIFETIQYRQVMFDEPLETSIKVVLFNYGERRKIAHCIRGDWSGPKAEMDKTPGGLPICPRCGSSATEEAKGWSLALVREGTE